MSKIRAALLGYGRTAKAMHLGAYEANADRFDVTAVCDIEPARLREAAERIPQATQYDDYHEMLERERPELVSVLTRSDQHAAMTIDCLEAGANVVVTKPWAVNADEAERMCEAEQRTGKMLLPWLPARWGSDLARLRELVADGAIGKVFLIRRAVRSFGTRSDWQTERRYGGGYLLNWGPHIIDPPVLLAGSPVSSVYGRMKQVINPGDTEDAFLALLTLADGTLVQAEHTIAVSGLPDWLVQGDRGTIVVNGDHLTLYQNTPAEPGDPTKHITMQSADERVIEEEIVGRRYGDEKQIYAEIAQALRGERAFPVTPNHALELSRVFDAVRLADRENRVVTL
jgi:scyllo-inositol 2-dehydrogenase (NADP+)